MHRSQNIHAVGTASRGLKQSRTSNMDPTSAAALSGLQAGGAFGLSGVVNPTGFAETRVCLIKVRLHKDRVFAGKASPDHRSRRHWRLRGDHIAGVRNSDKRAQGRQH
eukprot:scaffold11277_cov50-Prasinocladus_malaysianus.AAC.1